MNDVFSKEQKTDILASLQRYFDEELEGELNELQAALLLDFIVKEIAPFAYNKGVEDACAYLSARIDDLPGVCFQQGLTYWETKPGASRTVRRKTDR